MTTTNDVHKNIIVIGSIGYDEKIKIDKMPEIGKTEIGNYEIVFGGKGNIEAVACARTDGETIFLGAVGDKDYETFKKHFEEENITPILRKVKGVQSHYATILVDKEGKHRIIFDPRAGFYVDRELIDDNLEFINKASFILLQLEISFDTVEYIIDKFKNEKNIILRPSPITQLERLKKLIKNVNYLILNEVELGLISGEETKTQQQIEDASDKLMRLYQPKNVIVSLLDKGWLLRNKSEKKIFPFYDVDKIIDKVGSMDCFIGVFASYLSRNYDINDAIKYANLASRICACRVGTIPSLPYIHDIMSYKQKIENW